MAFSQKYFTADLHFSHEGMLSFGSRHFANVGEMNRVLIDNWNSTVRQDDIVFVLGDFSFELGNTSKVTSIFNELKGRKHLVIGNHDVLSDGDLHPTLAALPWASQPKHYMETRDCGERIILSHYGMRAWNASHHGSYHFFGHAHGKLPSIGRSRDVGVDVPDCAFSPRTFQQLIAVMDKEVAA
jgi:calcineurin-like phosphoesterase family protein